MKNPESELKRIMRLQSRTLKTATNRLDINDVDKVEIVVTEFDQFYECLLRDGDIVSRNLLMEAKENHAKLLEFL